MRNDPYVLQAATILETSRNRLLAAVVEGDVAESARLMDVFARATLLKEETEDGVRVRLGLLTQDEAARRAVGRYVPLAGAIFAPRRRGLALRRPLFRRQGVGDGHLQAIVGSTPM